MLRFDCFAHGKGATYCNEYVHLSVSSHNSKTTRPNFTKFLCTLLVAVARSSSDGVAIRRVFPVLRMTSCFHTVGPMGGRTGTALCSLALVGCAGRCSTLARRAGLLGRRRAVCPAAGLGDGVEHFAVFFHASGELLRGSNSAISNCLAISPSERSKLARYHVMLFPSVLRPSVRLCALSI